MQIEHTKHSSSAAGSGNIANNFSNLPPPGDLIPHSDTLSTIIPNNEEHRPCCFGILGCGLCEALPRSWPWRDWPWRDRRRYWTRRPRHWYGCRSGHWSGLGTGLGTGLGGLGVGLGMGQSYGSGGGYGQSGYAGGSNGYGNSGYGGSAMNVGHDIGHQESDYSQAVHSHQSSGHDVGGAMQTGQGGHNLYGHNNYGAGQAGYGQNYNQGGFLGY
ncbi:hypothetical protein HF086_002816 [Spodoptera exigua]|uniref:Uncharacterized protein n=1 Tax=Spodoptera exigua TaxID=7107 RepID=A0A922M015_SPOEX|nr:hypothetical protein HF086_002816 [Spodoptera exigua]